MVVVVEACVAACIRLIFQAMIYVQRSALGLASIVHPDHGLGWNNLKFGVGATLWVCMCIFGG